MMNPSIAKLKQECDAICESEGIAPNYLHYLAVPPEGYATLAKALSEGGMVHPPKAPNWSRLVVEKPFTLETLLDAITLATEPALD